MNKNLKMILPALLAGVLIAVLTGVFLLTVSLDMRHMSLWSLTLGFTAAYWAGSRNYMKAWVYIVVSMLPFVLFLRLVILTDLPSMWFMALLMGLSALLGFLMPGVKGSVKKGGMVAGVLLMMLFTVFYIPTQVSRDLTQTLHKGADDFSFTGPGGAAVTSGDLRGKVVVLDFYGTWCKPCIAELPELARVRDHFSTNEQVLFYIVNSDQGGDTPEKAVSFVKKYGNGFSFGYDHDRKTYKAIGLSGAGVPSLVILDRKGNVRLKHVGYNKAETDFVGNMIDAIDEILETD